MDKVVLLIHGGAGVIPKTDDKEKYKPYYEGLELALKKGQEILESGGSAIDAVTEAVMVMENSPSFNAGRGSVFTHDEKNEMDAAIMDGSTLDNGAISSVQNIKNPITLAKKVMEYKEHTYLTSTGALNFAREHKIEMAEDDYFRTELRYNQLLKAKNRGIAILDHDGLDEKKYGTVGAVALDSKGNLAAATSTGGITNKRYGRVGDTPIIGAGTYADNETCAISCTGKGEDFIKLNIAYDISARMKYKMETLHEAAITNIEKRLPEGAGGLIAVDRYGNYTLPFNSIGMFRGIFTSEGVFDVRIWE